MTLYLWNLAAYAIQLAAVVSVALAAIWLVRLRVPRISLRFWQAVMGMALLLPFAQAQRQNEFLQIIVQSEVAASAAQVGASLAPAGAGAASIILAILAAGIVVRLAWMGIGLLRLRSIVAGAASDLSLTQAGSGFVQSLGVRAALMVSDDLDGPATFGVRNPVVLVPRSVLKMPLAVQRAILCHELVHVKRRDWLHTIGEELWCALLWFHPAARVLASRLLLARETVVDEQTILITKDRRAYAEALLAFSDPQPNFIGVTPFIGRRTLSHRISLIAEEAPMSRRALAGFTLALTAALVVGAVIVKRFPMIATLHAQSKVYDPDPGSGLTLPRAVHEVKPEYTPAAREQKIQGSVLLRIVVSEAGDVTDVEVIHSLDTEFGLDEEAIDAAWQWKFTPGMKDGQPVAVRVILQMKFTLR